MRHTDMSGDQEHPRAQPPTDEKREAGHGNPSRSSIRIDLTEVCVCMDSTHYSLFLKQWC